MIRIDKFWRFICTKLWRTTDRFYGIFSAAYPTAYIVAPLFGSLMLASFGINGIWLGAAVVFILMALMSLTIDKKY